MGRLISRAAIWAAAAMGFQMLWPWAARVLAVPTGLGATAAMFGPLVLWALLLGDLGRGPKDASTRDLIAASLLYWALFISMALGTMWIASQAR